MNSAPEFVKHKGRSQKFSHRSHSKFTHIEAGHREADSYVHMHPYKLLHKQGL